MLSRLWCQVAYCVMVEMKCLLELRVGVDAAVSVTEGLFGAAWLERMVMHHVVVVPKMTSIPMKILEGNDKRSARREGWGG